MPRLPRARKPATSHDQPAVTLLYGRVSSDEQVESGSIENQRRFLGAYAELYGLTVAGAFWDEGVSGTIPLAERPGGAALLAAVREHPGAAVVVYKVDRLARRLAVLLDAHAELERAGAVIKSANEPFDTSTPMGKFLFQLLGSMAELERATITERTLAGRTRFASNGHWTGEAVALGYALEAVPGSDRPARGGRRARPVYRRVPYAPHLAIVEYRKGDVLLSQGAHEMEQYFVLDGILKRVVASPVRKKSRLAW